MIHLGIKVTTLHNISDNNSDSSDLLSLLDGIEQLFNAGRIVICSHSAAAVMFAIAFETQTLLTKLKAMHRRWETHLPFKEACTVDFVDWSNRMSQLSSFIKLSDCRYCLSQDKTNPSSHCLIDLYEQTKDNTTSVGDTIDPKQLMQHHAAMQDNIAVHREQCIEAVSKLVFGQLSQRRTLHLDIFDDTDAVRSLCSELLAELSEELLQLHEQQVKINSPEDYERLADRILLEAEYNGPTARREARDIMHTWRNGVPTAKLEESRKNQIEQTKEEIRKTRHGVKLEQYVNLDDDFYSQRSEFGRFLFNRRKDITREELYELVRLVYCVFYYQKDAVYEAEQHATTAATVESSENETLSLPTTFTQSLRESKAAVKLFYSILHRIEPYINKGGANVGDDNSSQCDRYKDWTWYHLQVAFEELHFLQSNSNKTAFGEFINSVFSHRKAQSVTRSLHRNTNVNSPSIVADIVKEFEPVRSLIKS